MKISVALSYFHRKIGPIPFLAYPSNLLANDEKARIVDIMDQAFEEGYFTHSLSSYTSCNYYFEIESAFARGNREMLMFSVIFPESPKPDVEEKMIKALEEFTKKMKENKQIFKAFYSTEDLKLDTVKIDELKDNYNLLRLMVKEEYWNIIQETRSKTDEEKIAEIMKDKATFYLVKMLEDGVITLSNLETWYKNSDYGNENSLKKILTALEREKIIFINQIGVESYVLLTKSIRIERVPPDFVITQFTQNKEIYNIYIGAIQEYFNNYRDNEKDALDLFNILSDRHCYTVIMQLKEGPIAMDALNKILSEKREKETIETIEYLKIYDIVREISYNDETLIVLISLIQLDTQFPQYLDVIIPKSSYAKKSTKNKKSIEQYKTNREILQDYDIELEDFADTQLDELPKVDEIRFEGSIFQGRTIEFKKSALKSHKDKKEEQKVEEIDWAEDEDSDEDDRNYITNKLRSLIPEDFFGSDEN